MISKATVFAIAMLAPGLAFAADSATTGAAPAVAAHDTATNAKSNGAVDVKGDVKADAKVKPESTVKTAKAKGHKAKVVPAAEKKTESKS